MTSAQLLRLLVERDDETGLLVGHIPGIAGAHSQAETLDELCENLTEVVAMLRNDAPQTERTVSHAFQIEWIAQSGKTPHA